MLQHIATLIATFFYTGRLPKMPGTWGSLAALPCAWYLWSLAPEWAWPIFALSVAIGIWAAHKYVRFTGKEDNQEIVIDEVLGIFVTAILAKHTLAHYAAVFVLFRLFDIWKPFPVRWFDDNVHGGLGVVLDDLVAGLWALLCIFLLGKFV
jgi:phosphatidylglycerophosphatase A